VDLLAQNYGAVFTNPQTTENQLAMLSANGSTKLSSAWTVSGSAYLRSFHQHRVDGNVSEVAPATFSTIPTRAMTLLVRFACKQPMVRLSQ